MLHQCAGIGVYGWDYLVLTGEQFITQLLSTLFTSQLLYISLTESVLHLYPSRADSQHIFVTFCMITTLNCFFTQALKSKQLASYLTQYRYDFFSPLYSKHIPVSPTWHIIRKTTFSIPIKLAPQEIFYPVPHYFIWSSYNLIALSPVNPVSLFLFFLKILMYRQQHSVIQKLLYPVPVKQRFLPGGCCSGNCIR